MNFTEFLEYARKAYGVNLDTLSKAVGASMVLYPKAYMRAIQGALAPVNGPDGVRWIILGACLEDGMTLPRAIIAATSPGCIKLLGGNTKGVMDDADKGFCLAVHDGLNAKFCDYFDFKKYWEKNGGDTITTQLGVYLVNSEEISKRFTALSSSGVF